MGVRSHTMRARPGWNHLPMLKLVNGRPPTLNSRYEIVGIIDVVGGVWHYLAWDEAEEAWCTVQMLGFKQARDRLARARFERGVSGLLRLKHPNILCVIEAEPEHTAHPYAVMEVTEAGTVAEWIASHGPMPPYLAIDVMSQVCGAVASAHRADITHGDLRSDQVLIDRLGSCKVSGFRGGSERQDQMIDIKAAGALLYTMITGRAFDDSRADQLVAGLSPAVGRAVSMTRKSRGGYADISTFSRDLEAAVLELPMPSGHVPPLAPADCALPDDPALVWSDDQNFDDLLFLSRLAEDPTYQPTAMELERSSFAGPETTDPGVQAAKVLQPKPAPASEPAPAPDRSQAMAAIPYVMSTAAEAASDSGPGYTFEEPEKKKEQWDNSWQASFEAKEAGAKVEELTEEQKTDQMLSRLVAAGAGFLLLVLSGAFFYGNSLVGGARADAVTSGKALVSLVGQESQLIYDMANAGADKDVLEASYFQFSDASGDMARIEAAAGFAQVVNQQARVQGLDPVGSAGSGGALIQRIDTLNQTYAAYATRRATWAQRSGSFPGMLPVLVGVAESPP